MTVTLSQDQESAFEGILGWYMESDRQTLTLGGYAGTGKTTVISRLLEHLEILDPGSVSVAAFTGKAVSVLQRKGVPSQTLHSLIYHTRPYCSDCGEPSLPNACSQCGTAGARANIELRSRKVTMLHAKLVIVDEASMLSTGLVEDLESLGRRVLYVGDHGQLEPVGDDPGLMRDPELRLEKIHRQAEGSSIIQFAHALRQGGDPCAWRPGALEDDNVRVRQGIAGTSLSSYDVVICGFNRTRVSVNKRIRKERGFHGGDPQVGERLICLQNDRDMGLFNGQMVIVTRVCDARGRLQLDFEDEAGGRWHKVPTSRRSFHRERKEKRPPGRMALFDFGYALTCHKAQGSEWANVAVMEQLVSQWDARRWRYTAATRASEKLDYFVSSKERQR